MLRRDSSPLSQEWIRRTRPHCRRVVASIGRENIFFLMNLLSLCASKEKEAKRKDASQGRSLVRGAFNNL